MRSNIGAVPVMMITKPLARGPADEPATFLTSGRAVSGASCSPIALSRLCALSDIAIDSALRVDERLHTSLPSHG